MLTTSHKAAGELSDQVLPVVPRGDYVSPGLKCVLLDSLFPSMQLGNKLDHPWSFLRRTVPHNWYVDKRYPQMGFVSRDEAMLLYNAALQFRDKPALEIGCWMGWSTAHLAAGGVRLDVIDPGLKQSDNFEGVTDALRAGGIIDKVRLYPVASPLGVDQLAELSKTKWSLIFIDGDHEPPGPVVDAEACLRHAAEDAMVIFHDLASPHVADGFDVFHRAGWQTMVYQTMQIMGVAWRGSVTAIRHTPDPTIDWKLPDHLTFFAVSGNSDAAEAQRLSKKLHRLAEDCARLQKELRDSKEAEQAADQEAKIQRAEADVARQELEYARIAIAKADEARKEAGEARKKADEARKEAGEAKKELECARVENASLSRRLTDVETLRQIAEDQIDRPGLRLAARAIRTRVPYLAARIVGIKS